MDVKAYRLDMEKNRFDRILGRMRREMPRLGFQNDVLNNRPNHRYEGNNVYMNPAAIAHWVKRIDNLADKDTPAYGLVLTDTPMCLEVTDMGTQETQMVYPIGYREGDIAAASSFRLGHKKVDRTAKVAMYELFKLFVEAGMESRTPTDFQGYACNTEGCYAKSGDGEFSATITDIRNVWKRIDSSHGFCRACRGKLNSITNL